MSLAQTLEVADELENILSVTKEKKELSNKERSYVENTLKAILATKRRNMSEAELNHCRKDRSIQQQYYKQRKMEYFSFCLGVIEFLDTRILPKTQSAQGSVFFLKVKGDFFRYSAECLRKGDHYYNTILHEGLKAYKKAYKIAVAELPGEDFIRLNLCLNFSVFYYTVANNPFKAIALLSKTLGDLNEEKNTIVDEIWKSIQPIMCLLKNNLILWVSEIKGGC